MTTIAVDGLNEEAFRRSIESRLRQGRSGEAVKKLRALLEPYAGEGRILPARFLSVQAGDLKLTGWEQLGEAISRNDRAGWPITALSIAFGWPGEEVLRPDERGHLSPMVETGYFTDESYPFSQSRREDLLEGYSYHGCTWAGDSTATDTVLALEGVDDLHGALAALEAELLASDAPDEEAIRAGSLGACLLSALLFQAVDERIKSGSLPRPLCVLAGSNGVYPYFDAPVSGMSEDAIKAAEAAEVDEAQVNRAVPGPRYSSLLVTGIPRARKRAVLVLEESPEQMALRTADLLSSNDAALPAMPPVNSYSAEPPAPALAEAGITPVVGGPLMAKKKSSDAWDFRDMLSPREDGAPDHLNVPEPEVPHDNSAKSETHWPEADLSPQDAAPDIVPEAEITIDSPEPEVPHDNSALSEPAWPDADLSPQDAAPDIAPESDITIDAPVPFEPEDRAFDFSPPTSQPVSVRTPAPGFDLLGPPMEIRLESLIKQSLPVPDVADEIQLVAPETCEPLELTELALPEPMTLPEGPVWCFGIGYLEDAEEEAAAWQGVIDWAEPPGPGLWARLRNWLMRRG